MLAVEEYRPKDCLCLSYIDTGSIVEVPDCCDTVVYGGGIWWKRTVFK